MNKSLTEVTSKLELNNKPDTVVIPTRPKGLKEFVIEYINDDGSVITYECNLDENVIVRHTGVDILTIRNDGSGFSSVMRMMQILPASITEEIEPIEPNDALLLDGVYQIPTVIKDTGVVYNELCFHAEYIAIRVGVVLKRTNEYGIVQFYSYHDIDGNYTLPVLDHISPDDIYRVSIEEEKTNTSTISLLNTLVRAIGNSLVRKAFIEIEPAKIQEALINAKGELGKIYVEYNPTGRNFTFFCVIDLNDDDTKNMNPQADIRNGRWRSIEELTSLLGHALGDYGFKGGVTFTEWSQKYLLQVINGNKENKT